MQVFSREWFGAHQKKLLVLLNHPWTRSWFRRVMKLRTYKPILSIFPDSYCTLEAEDGDIIQVSDHFFSHCPVASQLRNALLFKPVWNVFHFWDWLVADRYRLPKLSFGFSTLTSTPDQSRFATTCDGEVQRASVDESFATICAGAGTVLSDNEASNTIGLQASSTTNQFGMLSRAFFSFQTILTLPATNTITNVALLLFQAGILGSNLGSVTFNIVSASPAAPNTIVTTDFTTCGTTIFGSYTGTALISENYLFIFNTNGINALNLSGITSFGGRTTWDITGTFTGSWALNSLGGYNIYFADSGISTAPQLTITYATTGRPAAGYGLVRGFYANS